MIEGNHRQAKHASQEQAPHGGGSNSPESQPLPSVWDVLERIVRLEARADEGQISNEEYDREYHEQDRLKRELKDRGSDRDKLILDLYTDKTMHPAHVPVPVEFIDLTPEEFQQFRAKVEPLSEERIREEIRKTNEEYARKRDAKPTRRPPGMAMP